MYENFLLKGHIYVQKVLKVVKTYYNKKYIN